MRAFVAVVEEGGLSAAARRMHISQPALSQTVGALEREFGVQLLIRSYTGAQATEAGMAQLAEALAFFAAVDPKKVSTALQYDLAAAYVDFYAEDPTVARGMVETHKDRGAHILVSSKDYSDLILDVVLDLLEWQVPRPQGEPRRRAMRGFDPAEQIARSVARRRSLELVPCLRRGMGPRQVGRSRAERVTGPPSIRLRGRPPIDAIVVDDVATTGATLRACATALRAGGAARVVAVTFAAAPRPPGFRALCDWVYQRTLR